MRLRIKKKDSEKSIFSPERKPKLKGKICFLWFSIGKKHRTDPKLLTVEI